MIEPSNGRIVWYTPWRSELEGNFGMCVQKDNDGNVVPLAAQVCAVWNARMVNLLVTDANGKTFAVTSRRLLQDDDVGDVDGGYCQWMPYQQQQAAKTEALEAKQH